VLETEGGIGLLVYTAEEFTDFTLRLQWRAPTIRNNAGVYVRLPKNRLDGSFDELLKSGYEVQIDNTGDRPGEPFSFGGPEQFNAFHQTGAIYPVHGAANPPMPNGMASVTPIPTRRLGEWNDYEIAVRGNTIRVVLNGQPVLIQQLYTDTANRYPTGLIALQNHFKGSRVQFRHLRIQTP
jgi:hypothetical protein